MKKTITIINNLITTIERAGIQNVFLDEARKLVAELEKQKIVFEKDYCGFESISDLERDISEMWEDTDIPGEFQGTVKVKITYEELCLEDEEDAN